MPLHTNGAEAFVFERKAVFLPSNLTTFQDNEQQLDHSDTHGSRLAADGHGHHRIVSPIKDERRGAAQQWQNGVEGTSLEDYHAVEGAGLRRVQLQQLVKRVYVPGMEKGAFHLQLLQNVREEFEHNLAQQLYVANTTWNAVVNAKEELVNQINETFEQLKDEEDVSIIAQSLVALPNPMVEQAVAVLKRDFERLL